MSFAKRLLLNDVHYSAWANRRLLEACSALTDEEVERDVHISHASVLATLAHIFDGERVWFDCLHTTPDRGTWRLPPGPAPGFSLEELRQRWPEIWQGFSRWLEASSESSLQDELMLQLPEGIEQLFPRWKILRHVLNHSTLHRGQIVGMIRMLGHMPPGTSPMDYYLSSDVITTA